MKKVIHFVTTATATVVAALFCTVSYLDQTLPEHYYVHQGQSLTINSMVRAGENLQLTTTAGTELSNNSTVNLDLFGIIPIKQTRVSEVAEIRLIPGGTPFGIKLLTEGVLVVGLNNIESEQGMQNPAKESGLKVGDVIVSINDTPITSNEDISSIVKNCNGDELNVTYKRDEQQQTTTVLPVLSRVDGKPKVGIWVRDSSAGIGTITFFSDDNQFGGLGHAVCDVDTGMVLPISYGEIVPAVITGVQKGTAGSPGSLIGAFTDSTPLGNVQFNTECGVFGELSNTDISSSESIPMAFKQEVHTGPATILSTIDGDEPKEFTVDIEQINMNEHAATKNMVVRVTDQELIDQTGGIVQGMSGSPIIQDGKLVGAVTHVFVNNPTQGYGIFVENMLSIAQELEEQELPQAS